jgi:hypothetical protein
VLVVGRDEHTVADDDGRSFDLRAGLERPAGLAVRGVKSVHDAEQVADIDGAVDHHRRGFAEAVLLLAEIALPEDRAVVEGERSDEPRQCGHIHNVVDDGGGGVDGKAGLEAPEKRQLVGDLGGRASRAHWASAKLIPRVFRRDGLLRRDRQQSEDTQ